jgi:hypothetical protein
MELVDLEHVFGGERIVIYYLAEKRVDFRAKSSISGPKWKSCPAALR